MRAAADDSDRLLLAAMSEPPPLEQARASLEFWMRRRAGLRIHHRRARKEADEMIRRCRERVAAAERRRYGSGPIGFMRRVIAGDGPSLEAVRAGLVALVWALVPRRVLLAAAAFVTIWAALGVVVLVVVAQLLA